MEPRLEHRALLAVDIAHSAARGNVALHRIRDVLRESLREALEESGIDWDACLRDDLGDGFRITAPPGVRKRRLIHPLLPELAVRLRAHNRMAGPLTSIRVRVALHAGDVCLGRDGQVTGRPLEVLARLLDARQARAALDAAPDTVTASLLISQHFYDETVRHGYPGIEPETFGKVTLAEKEHAADAWLHLPGYTGPPHTPEPDATTAPADESPAAPAPADEAPAARAPGKMVNRASGNGVVYATQHGTQNIHLTRGQ
ncbi:hypothetical protein DTL70_08085 [Streptomyces diacarni]|uniref:Adenylate cyclase n=1 Tax=Streptomyces diacarni TaxID=2800381 RepID=A0A367F859_9ACTN|nr:hypothetical protein [Streptomyces diacarni]RCG26129.1 hypothetical protein DTL70_08085 [Streptomyces diacarni]